MQARRAPLAIKKSGIAAKFRTGGDDNYHSSRAAPPTSDSVLLAWQNEPWILKLQSG